MSFGLSALRRSFVVRALPRVLMGASAALVAAVAGFGPAKAAVADDPTGAGPYTPVSADYKLTATVDPLVSKTAKDDNGNPVKTELWARVWYPTKGPSLKDAPIVVFLHGEHGTCGRMEGKWRIDDNRNYSFDGTCPTGYQPTPNHWGYDYVASRLATQGYVTISINTNRGINQVSQDATADPDPGLIIRRGRMILRHLMQFGEWDRGVGSPGTWFNAIKGKMDWSKVSLVGHSRGGDAILNAYYQFKGNTDGWKSRLPTNMQIVAIAAMAPTDFAVQKVDPADPLPLKGVGYGVLLPMCDGDVIRLSGVRFYDRAVGYFPDQKGNFKAVFAVGGADHNGFNTEWHNQDRWNFVTGKATTHECPGQKKLFPKLGTSAEQQEIGRYFVMAVVRAKTKDGSWAETLNPAFDLPKPLKDYTIDRSWYPGTPLNGALLMQRFSVASVANPDCSGKAFGYAGVNAICAPLPEHLFNFNNLADKTNTWIASLRWNKPANKKKPFNGGYWVFVNLQNEPDYKPINLGKSSKLKTLDMRLAPDCDLVFTTDGNFACQDVTKQAPDEKGAQNIGVQFVDDKRRYSNRHFVEVKKFADERQAVGIKTDDPSLPADPLYHSILSSVRIPLSEFEKNADKGFDMSKVTGMLLLLSLDGLKKDNNTGGLFLGDVWATTEAITSMNFDAPVADAPALAGVTPPAPPSAEELAQNGAAASVPTGSSGVSDAPALASGSADVGARIVDAARTTLPAAAMPASLGLGGSGDVAVVELKLASRTPLIQTSSGLRVSIGGKVVEAAVIGGDERQTRIAVPAALVDQAGDGAAIAVVGGASTLRFGGLSASAIR